MRLRLVVVSLVMTGAVVIPAVVVTSRYPEPTRRSGAGQQFLATVTIERPVTGVVDADIRLRRRDGAPTGVEAVAVSGAMPAMGHVPPERPARRVGPDRFRVRGELFSMPGTWALDIRVESTYGAEVIGIEVPVERGGR